MLIIIARKQEKPWYVFRQQLSNGFLCFTSQDYCNALYYNMTNENIHKLQLNEDHAASLGDRAPHPYWKICIDCPSRTL